jgi:hypothetical protein
MVDDEGFIGVSVMLVCIRRRQAPFYVCSSGNKRDVIEVNDLGFTSTGQHRKVIGCSGGSLGGLTQI